MDAWSVMKEDEDLTVLIHCPVCGGCEVSAQVRVETLAIAVFWVIARDYYVRCSECGAEMMVVGVAGDQLPSLSADELSVHLAAPASRQGAIQATLAIVTCWIPVLGCWVARRAWRTNRDSHGLPKLASLAAFIVSLPFTLGFVMGAVLIPIMLLLQALAGV